MNTLRRIEHVIPKAPCALSIIWKDGGTDLVDMSDVINGLEVFAPLRDGRLFASVGVIDWGSGIEWSNGLDYSSDSLAQLAADQREKTAGDIRKGQETTSVRLLPSPALSASPYPLGRTSCFREN